MARYAKQVVDLANGGIFARVVARNFHFTKATREALEQAHRKSDDLARRIPIKKSRRTYVGATPTKTSATGQDVIAKMNVDRRIRGWDPNNPRELAGVKVKGPDGQWLPIEKFDMGHVPVDAVSHWNNVGRYQGPKSTEVRDWMTDAENYELIPKSLNRSDGGALSTSGVRYQPPVQLPDGMNIQDIAPDILKQLPNFK